METGEKLRRILRDSLQLGERADKLAADTRLLGGLPEFDSMAVVSVLTMIEDEFGIAVDDDEVSGETFETFGSLARFVQNKVGA